MASTFSTSLKLELIGDGEQSGIWGQTTNTNLGTLLEQAITGVVSITMVDANYTLTNFNGVSDESRNAVLVVGGTNAAVRDIIAPLVEKLYVVKNNTAGGFAINIRAASGSSVSVPNGTTVWVYCDGTNFNAINAASSANSASTVVIRDANGSFAGNAITATTLSGSGASISAINASNIASGTVATARLGSGTANSATFLRGDQTYAAPSVSSVNTTNFTIQQVGSALVFQYNGANVAVMDSGGNLTSAGAFTAGGSV